MAIKLNKQLAKGLAENGISEVKEFQQKLHARLSGGASVYLSGESGLGKTTGILIATLQRLNYSMPDTPRAIVMMSDPEAATEFYNRAVAFAKHMDLRIHLVTDAGKIDDQNHAIYVGADLIIGTPGRLSKLYFQCGINVNKVQFLVLDDANKLVENRHLVELDRFADSLPKFQCVVCDTTLLPRLVQACKVFAPYAQELVAQSE